MDRRKIARLKDFYITFYSFMYIFYIPIVSKISWTLSFFGKAGNEQPTMSRVFEAMKNDPVFGGGIVGDGVNIMKGDDGLFCLETKKCSLPIGNCPKCFSAGAMHDYCRYCHTKETPTYYTAIVLTGVGPIHSIYLSYCAKKPMDFPTTMKEVEECVYKRPESEFYSPDEYTGGTEASFISMEEYCIKTTPAEVPPGVMERMNAIPIAERNRMFRESIIVPDDHSKYFVFRVIQATTFQRAHFALLPTTLEDLVSEIGLV